MQIHDAFPSQYWTRADLEVPVMLTIEAVRNGMVKDTRGNQEEKPLMYFLHEKKKLIMKPVVWKFIAKAYGPDSNDWEGKRIELYDDETVTFGDEVTGGIRCRIPGATAKPAASSATALKALSAQVDAFDEAAVAADARAGLIWTPDIALAELAKVGIDKATFKARKAELGMGEGWNGARDTRVAQEMIASVNGDEKLEPEEDSIPF